MKKRRFKVRFVMILAIICYFGYILFDQQAMMVKYKKEIEQLNAEKMSIEETNANLQDEIDFAQTKEYKERMAREKMGLIMPGEKTYVIKEE
ncbi:cell division protein FtsL [Oxobacter pfennigii]|uniref:Cell division protein FtsL n=1 Tax=Oxobacter pfennigii TaxID=36849 RepID=A0A0N8NSR6_9CLOT|nr:septum formation initiator family protein [Oxobacter pfennigii]KPU42776.1 cell division protein FtsL [Oxobacter pfennigii]